MLPKLTIDRARIFLDSKGCRSYSGVFNVADLYRWLQEFEAFNLETIERQHDLLVEKVSLTIPQYTDFRGTEALKDPGEAIMECQFCHKPFEGRKGRQGSVVIRVECSPTTRRPGYPAPSTRVFWSASPNWNFAWTTRRISSSRESESFPPRKLAKHLSLILRNGSLFATTLGSRS